MSRYGVLTVTNEPATARAVETVLRSSPRLATDGIFRRINDLAACLEPNPQRLVLVDVDPDPDGMLRELAGVTARFPQTRFVMVCQTFSNELLLQAMRSGIQTVLPKDSIAPALAEVLEKLVPAQEALADAQGALVTVLSAAGGCGATTVAVNLAHEIHTDTGEPVLLVDLDMAYGAVAGYLGINPRYGIGDILARPGRIDHQVIRSSTASTETCPGVEVLASPASIDPTAAPRVHFPNLPDVLQVCRQAYKYCVVDAPRLPLDQTLLLARASKLTFIMLQLTVKDLACARVLRDHLIRGGVAPERIAPLANRYKKRSHMISLGDGARALGVDELPYIRNDFAAAIDSMNYGRPLAKTAPRSEAREDLRRLVRRLCAANGHVPQTK